MAAGLLHVVMASPWPPWRKGGGTELHTHELAKALSALPGVRVTVLTVDWPGREGGEPYAVELVDSPRMARLRRLEGRLPVGGMTARRLHDALFNRKAAQAARRLKADVLHRQGASSVPLRTPIPVVLTLHNGTIPADEATPAGLRHLLLWPLGELDRRRRMRGVRRCLAAADQIICVSDHVADKVVARLGATTPSVTIPNGIAIPPATPAKAEARRQLGIGKQDRVVLFVGRLSREKRPERLLPLLKDPSCRLVLLGTGPLEGRLRSEAETQPRLQVLGFQPEEAKRLWLRAADVLALPSGYFEGNPLVMLEALRLGTPVYGTHAQWLPAELRRFGRFGDDVLLALDAMGIDASAAAGRVATWDDVARETLRVYEAVLPGRRQASPMR